MGHQYRKWIFLGMLCFGLIVLASGSVTAQSNFYTGKLLEVICPASAGGGTDVWARLVTPYLQKYLGPKATIQIIYITGAGTIKGVNQFALVRKHDGLTAIVTVASTAIPYIIGEPAVRYDYKNFVGIMGSPNGSILYGSPKAGITEAAKLRNPPTPLIYAGQPATTHDLLPLTSFEILGLKVKTILGYKGRGMTRLAFEKGESNIDFQSTAGYTANVIPLVKEGKAVPLYCFGAFDKKGNIVRDASFPEVPTIREVYIEFFGKEPSGVAWEAMKALLASCVAIQKMLWLHKDAPPEAIKALRNASRQTAEDPEFLERAARTVGKYPFHVGEDAERAFAPVLEVPPESLAWLKKFLREKYGVERLK